MVKCKKICPQYGTDGRLLLRAKFFQVQSHVKQIGQNQKSSLTKFTYCPKESAVICQLSLKIVKEIDIENGRISNFQCHMTLTSTLERAIWHTVVHHSLISTYTSNFKSEKLFVDGRTDVHLYVRAGIKTNFIRATHRSWPNKTLKHFTTFLLMFYLTCNRKQNQQTSQLHQSQTTTRMVLTVEVCG